MKKPVLVLIVIIWLGLGILTTVLTGGEAEGGHEGEGTETVEVHQV